MNRTQLTKKVENKLDRYQIRYRKHIAETGSAYYTLKSNKGSFSTTVRVSDHDDCYSTSDITINPVVNQYKSFCEWVEKHGTQKTRKPVTGQFYVYGVKAGQVMILAEKMTKKNLMTCNDWFERYEQIVVSKDALFTGGWKAELGNVDLTNTEKI